MELDEFVSTTLRQIINGVQTAQDELSDSGATVNPTNIAIRTDQLGGRGHQRGNIVRNVDFNVAVAASQEESSEAGAGIFVGGLGLGVRESGGEASQHMNRIKFTVPLLLPPGEND